MSTSVGSVSVDVVPSVRDFASKLRSQILPDSDRVGKEVGERLASGIIDGVRDGVERARAKLDELGAGSHDVTVRVDADTAVARAKIDELDHNREVNVKVDANTGEAEAKVAAVGAAAQSSSGGMSALIAAGIALGPALIPVAGACVAALAAVGNAAAGAAAGAGVAFLALKPIIGAVQALGAQQSASLTAQSPAAQLAQANAIASANATLTSAESSLTNARASAASAQVNAAQRVSDARRSLGDAERQAAQGIASAQAQVVTSEQSLAAAQYQEGQAQQALTAARKSAQQQLEDYNLQLADGALAQRAATLAIEQAKQNLTNVNLTPGSSKLQKEQAQLAYDQAVQHNTDLGVQQERLKATAAAAAKAGVDGSQQVIAAQHGVESAHQGVANAQTAVVKAQQAVVTAQTTGAEQVAKAQEGVASAIRAQSDQARTSAASIVAAQQGVVNAQRGVATANAQIGSSAQTAADNVKAAFASLSPAGAEFATFIFSLKGKFDDLSKTAQDGLLPGLQGFIQALLPYLPGLIQFVGTLAKTMGDLAAQAGKALTGPFWTQFFDFLGGKAGGWLSEFATTFGNIVKGAAGLFQALSPVGDILNGMIADGAKKFADWATSLSTNTGFQTFLGYLRDTLPGVVTFLGDLIGAFGSIIRALAPLGPVILAAIDWVAKFLAELSPVQLGLITAAIGLFWLALGGPVSAVGIALAGLAIVVANLWQSNETLRTVVTNVWTAVRDFIVGAWEQHIKPALSALWSFFEIQLMPTILKLWHDVVQPAFTTIGAIIASTWNSIIFPALQALWAFITNVLAPVIGWLVVNVAVPLFKQLGDAIAFAWEHVIKPALDFFKGAIDSLPAAFTTARDAIGEIWTKVADKVKGPLNTVLGFVQDHFISPLQSLLDTLHIDLKLPTLPQFADGGFVGNALRGYATGGYTGDGGKYEPMGVVHGGEYVINKESTARIMAENPSLLAGLNGYADGGLVGTLGSAFSSVKDFVSNGISGVQAFINDPIGAVKGFVDGILGGLGDSPFPKIASAVLSKVGDALAAQVQGSIASQQGGGVGGAAGSADAQSSVAWALSQVGTSGWLNQCLAMVNAAWGHKIPWLGLPRAIDAWNAAPGKHTDTNAPGGAALFYNTGAGRPGHVDLAVGDGSIVSTDLPISNILGHVPFNTPMSQWGAQYLGWAMPDGSSALPNAAASFSAGGTGVERWSSLVTQMLALEGQPSNLLSATLRRMNQESGGNPNAINLTDSNARAGTPSKGLMQVIDPTFATYHDSSLSGNIYDPAANIAASMRYAVSRYGSLAAAYNRPGGYADGGFVKPLLFDSGGYLPTGVSMVQNDTGKPEPLMRMDQPMHITGTLDSQWGPVQVDGQIVRALEAQNRALLAGAR